MAGARISDTGAEIRPVELWVDNNGTPSRMMGAQAGTLDGASPGALVTFWNFPLVFNGATWDRLRTPSKFTTVNLAAGTAETTVWTPAAGKKFRLMGLVLTAGAACDIELRDNTGGPVIFYVALSAAPLVLDLGNGILSGAANRPLTVTRSVSTTLKGTLFGTEDL